MSCQICQLKVNEQYSINFEMTCRQCGHSRWFSDIQVRYLGYELDSDKGYKTHLFLLHISIYCPKCGYRAEALSADCSDEGYVWEIGTVIELPVPEYIEINPHREVGEYDYN